STKWSARVCWRAASPVSASRSKPAASSSFRAAPVAIEAADVLVETVEALSQRAPAIVAAAAQALGETRLMLYFGDGSVASLIPRQSRLVAARSRAESTVDVRSNDRERVESTVDVHFDDRAMRLLFDAQRRPIDQILEGSLDIRGT